MAKYHWEQARIFGYRGTLIQFLSALNLGHILQQGSDIIDEAKSKGISELTEGDIAGGLWLVDFIKGIKMLKDPDLWKTPTKQEIADMKQRVAALTRAYHAVQTLGYRTNTKNL